MIFFWPVDVLICSIGRSYFQTHESRSVCEECRMISSGSRITTIFLVILGLLFTVASVIFGSLNAFSNPIQTVMAVPGLLVWNGVAGKCDQGFGQIGLT